MPSKARKTSAVPTRIWKYGIYSHQCEIEGRDQVEDQLRLVNRYRNQLVEIERERRQRYNQAVQEFPEVAALTEQKQQAEQELAELRRVIKERRSQARGRVRSLPEESKRAEELKQQLRGINADLKAAKKRCNESPTIEATQEWAFEAVRTARKADEAPYWGSYLLIEDSMKNAAKGAPPEFRRYDRLGRLGVQIQSAQGKGLTTEGLLGCLDQRARLEFPTDDPTEGRLWLRVGSGDGRHPVWAKFPMKYHRPLPSGALIKWVWCGRTRHDAKGSWGHPDDARVWDCCLVLEHPSFEFKPRLQGHKAAINLGFRRIGDEDGLRIAYCVGTDGWCQEITIQGIMSSLDWADGRHSKRDLGFNAIKQEFQAWLQGPIPGEVPEWLIKQTATLGQWRSMERLDRLVSHWRVNRFDGDQEIYPKLYRWSAEDRHGRQHEGGIRMKAYGRRKDHYRRVAHELCKRYSVIRVPKMNLADLRRKAKPEQGESQLEQVQRRQFNIASQGEFLAALRLAASNLGTTLVETPVVMPSGRGVSQVHSICGKLHEQDRRQAIRLECPHCRQEFDQDRNAAENLLRMEFAEAAE